MNDPIKAREALYELSHVLQTHRLKLRDVVESATQCFEMLNGELEGDVAEEIYRAWTSIKERFDEHLNTAATTEAKVRDQAEELSSF